MQPFKPDYGVLAHLAIYIAGLLLAGAVLAPVAFFAAQAWIRHHPESGVSQVLASTEFPGYFNRCAMLAAFAGLVPLLRAVHLSWKAIAGSLSWRTGWKHLGFGFLAATAGTVAMGFACWAGGACKMKSVPNWDNWLVPLVSGFSVATMEEILFRGVILGVLCHSLGKVRGLYWATGIFALVHFLKPPASGAFAADEVTWTSGFLVIPQLFRGFGLWQNFVGEFMLLFAVGWVLAQARHRTDGLWLSIGLHAGWVASMKYLGQIVTTTTALRTGELTPWMVPNTCRSIVSPIVGVLPVVMVFLTGLLVLWLLGARQPSSSEKGVATPPV